MHNVQNYVKNAPAKAPRSLSITGKNKEQINENSVVFTFLLKKINKLYDLITIIL